MSDMEHSINDLSALVQQLHICHSNPDPADSDDNASQPYLTLYPSTHSSRLMMAPTASTMTVPPPSRPHPPGGHHRLDNHSPDLDTYLNQLKTVCGWTDANLGHALTLNSKGDASTTLNTPRGSTSYHLMVSRLCTVLEHASHVDPYKTLDPLLTRTTPTPDPPEIFP